MNYFKRIWILGTLLWAAPIMSQTVNVLNLSQDYLYAVRTFSWQEADSLKSIITKLRPSVLEYQLNTDNSKRAFWLNIYNGVVQYELSKDAERYQKRSAFFKAKLITVAGYALSLDEIEHGILRHSKNKFAFGYLPKLIEHPIIKKWRVNQLDNRIHFALNCGATSCPPIAFYEAKDLDAQLKTAEAFFIPASTTFDAATNTIKTTRILSWFRGDFGGKKGIRKLLVKYGFEQANDAKLVFEPYNWSLELKKYSN